jgi:hypothetical protein
MTWDPAVLLKAFMRTHHAWHELLMPVTRVATTKSARDQPPFVLVTPCTTAGATTQKHKQRNPTTTVDTQAIMNRLTASLSSFGNMIACVYSRVTPAAMIAHTAANEPYTPKSVGEKRRLMIGVKANPMTWAKAVPDITTRTFPTKTDLLSLAVRCRR